VAGTRRGRSIRWALATDLLGVGVVVFPPLTAAQAVGTGGLVLALGCVAMLGAGWLFLQRPFGHWAVPSVTSLPARWRLGYAAGFTGGAAYCASSAAALLCLVSPLRPGQALVAVLGGAVLMTFARPLPGAVKTTLALVAALAVPTSPPVEAVLGSQAAGSFPMLIAAFAAVLLAVGWEAVPRRHARPGDVAVVGLVCCLAVTAGCLWSRQSMVGPAHIRVVGLLTAVALTAFVAGNVRAVANFCLPAATGGAARSGRVLSSLPVLALALAQQHLFDRGWLLVLPGAATSALYCGYALGRPVSAAARPTAALHR
jgi:hypothetical protein